MVLQGHVLFQVLEEVVEFLIHQTVGGAAVGGRSEVLRKIADVLPRFARSVVLHHHLPDGESDAAAVEGSRLTSFFVGFENLVKLWEKDLFLLGEVGVELFKRLLHSLPHLMKFGVAFAVDTLYLLYQLQQFLVVLMKTAVISSFLRTKRRERTLRK